MIYDLSALFRTIPEAGLPNSVQRHQAACLLAIAERLEALVDASKPRWVEFEWFSKTPIGGKFVIDANQVEGLSEIYSNGVFSHCEISLKSDGAHYVKGTLAEVIAKLRGDQ